MQTKTNKQTSYSDGWNFFFFRLYSSQDGISDNKVKFGKIYTLQPIILCYMDIPMHPSLKK